MVSCFYFFFEISWFFCEEEKKLFFQKVLWRSKVPKKCLEKCQKNKKAKNEFLRIFRKSGQNVCFFLWLNVKRGCIMRPSSRKLRRWRKQTTKHRIFYTKFRKNQHINLSISSVKKAKNRTLKRSKIMKNYSISSFKKDINGGKKWRKNRPKISNLSGKTVKKVCRKKTKMKKKLWFKSLHFSMVKGQ